MDFTKIDWTVFLLTEKTNIKKALTKNDYKSLMILLEEPTPAKEIEIQKIVNLFSADADDYPSEVRKEMETSFINKNVQDFTPEEEAEWQKKLDAEKEIQKNKVVNKEKLKNEVLVKVVTDGIDKEAVETDETEPVVVTEPIAEEPVVTDPVAEESSVVDEQVFVPKEPAAEEPAAEETVVE